MPVTLARTGQMFLDMLDLGELQNRIKDTLAQTGIVADSVTCGKLAVYLDGVLEWNEKINLTAITETERAVWEHIVDSAAIVRLPEYEVAERICDVGTGAGFPGVVMAALSPEKKVTLVDSLGKRLRVIEELAGKAGIDNIEIVHARAEDAGRMKELRESFDVVTARAVAALPVLAELCVPLVRKGGVFVAYKGTSAAEEIKDSERAANILGVGSVDIQDAGVPGMEHVFVIMKKTGNTPGKYPRKAGDPARNPL